MLERIDTSGTFIHVKCRRELRTASKKFKTCLLCKKNLHKAPRIGSSAACVELESGDPVQESVVSGKFVSMNTDGKFIRCVSMTSRKVTTHVIQN